MQNTMLQKTLSLLRRQFLGLNRILSTVMELVSEGLGIDDESRLIKFAANLLVNNHNFQFCTIHLVDNEQLQLAAATSTETMMATQAPNLVTSPWMHTCEHLAGEVLAKSDGTLLKRQSADSYYYCMPIFYRGETLGIISVNSPGEDENHPKLLSIFARTLTVVLINVRQSQHLSTEVKRRTLDLETAWRVAEESLNVKSQFLTNMSHEYRTPLNSVVGSTALLLETNLDSEQLEYARSAHDAALALTAMVNDMLDYSQSESGELKVHQQSFKLDDLINARLDVINAKAASKNIEVELLKSTNLPALVISDPVRIGQVLDNLLSNAFKFTPMGKVVLDISCEPNWADDVSLTFCVSDTGIGISNEHQQTIFNPFSQADSSNSRAFQGAGLGLTISQHLVNLMGGFIKLESELDKGSSFSFTLTMPATKSIAHNKSIDASEPDNAESDHGDDRIMVLLVEDNLINQKLAAKLLEKMGCRVDIADDGLVAVEMFAKHFYDLVFMDCQMPKMDGFEATIKIREMETDHRTPIIALTANSLPEDRARSFAAGMDEFLTKPIIRERLKDTLAKWATQH
jgi:signal transduction histidine kinase/CheY-like chemotaxis protein